jgi:predicted Zn-dependent protease
MNGKLGFPEIIHLRAALGWLELGNHLEANEELENIAPELRAHPDVLELRWQIYAKELKWDACREISNAITKQDPTRASGWIHLAYAARRASGGSVNTAWNILHPVAEHFPTEPIIHYNLACYASQLGNLKEAWNRLETAFDLSDDPAKLKLMALEESDLEPLWNDISEI